MHKVNASQKKKLLIARAADQCRSWIIRLSSVAFDADWLWQRPGRETGEHPAMVHDCSQSALRVACLLWSCLCHPGTWRLAQGQSVSVSCSLHMKLLLKLSSSSASKNKPPPAPLSSLDGFLSRLLVSRWRSPSVSWSGSLRPESAGSILKALAFKFKCLEVSYIRVLDLSVSKFAGDLFILHWESQVSKPIGIMHGS